MAEKNSWSERSETRRQEEGEELLLPLGIVLPIRTAASLRPHGGFRQSRSTEREALKSPPQWHFLLSQTEGAARASACPPAGRVDLQQECVAE